MTRFHFLFNFILSFCLLARSPSLVALGHYLFLFLFLFFLTWSPSLVALGLHLFLFLAFVFVFLDLDAFIGCTGSLLVFVFVSSSCI